MTPLTLEVALQVQDELTARAKEVDLWRAQRVQRAREEVNLSRQRFMQTHPDNRLVADVLEAEWNAKLRALDAAQRELERSRTEPGEGLDEGQRRRILGLASDFPRLWNDPATPHRERKRMARLLIEDVTVTKATRSLGVRLRGGATRQLTWVPHPHMSEVYRTSEKVIAEVDRLLNDHTDGETAEILNERGHRSGFGHAFTPNLVMMVRRNHALKSCYQRLRDRGLLRTRRPTRGVNLHNPQMEWAGSSARSRLQRPTPIPVRDAGPSADQTAWATALETTDNRRPCPPTE